MSYPLIISYLLLFYHILRLYQRLSIIVIFFSSIIKSLISNLSFLEPIYISMGIY